jgi:hypothetical protein
MSKVEEFALELASELAVPDLPFYLRCLNPEMRAEARRAYILAFITDCEGVLLKNWEEEAVKLEAYLKTGVAVSPPRNPMKLVK